MEILECMLLNDLLTAYNDHGVLISLVAIRRVYYVTSNPELSSLILREKPLSESRTLISRASFFFWTSFRMARRSSTADSKVRMKGAGSKADKNPIRTILLRRDDISSHVQSPPLIAG